MNTTRSPLSTLKSVLNDFVGWFMLITLITGIRIKDSIKTIKDRLEKN